MSQFLLLNIKCDKCDTVFSRNWKECKTFKELKELSGNLGWNHAEDIDLSLCPECDKGTARKNSLNEEITRL